MITAGTLATIGINTLMLAAMYILAAMGFAFIFNMLGTINLAHSSIYMIGAYVSYAICNALGCVQWLAMLISAVIFGALGLLLERCVIRPFKGDFDRIVMVGAALMQILSTVATLISGTKTLTIDSLADGAIKWGKVSFSKEKLVIFIIGAVIVLIILYIVNFTVLGKQMKALAQDRIGAALMGIPVNKVAAIVCVIGCAIAALAGGLMGSYQGLTVTMGDTINLRIIMLVLLSGYGSMNGIIVTGLIVAFCDSLFPVLVQGQMASALALLVVIILLLLRPRGFFGHEM